MQNIFLKATLDSPEVILDSNKNLIEFSGKSYPGNSFEFYKPLLQWITDYVTNNQQTPITVNLKLLYFNSSTSQTICNLLDILNTSQNPNLEINWYYHADDEDSYEDYEDIVAEFPTLSIKAIAF